MIYMKGESKDSKWYGLPPGTVMPEEYGGKPLKIRAIRYGEDNVQEEKLDLRIDERAAEPVKPVNWLDIVGVENGPFLEKLGSLFSIHPLVLEDIQNTV
jgi:magnesium transporter